MKHTIQAAIIALGATAVAPAFTHAHLRSATPAVDATVQASPRVPDIPSIAKDEIRHSP